MQSFSEIFYVSPIVASALAVAATVLYEHFGRLYAVRYRPTYFINYVATQMRRVFRAIGRAIAILSAFVEWLRLDELARTLCDLVEAVWGVLTSWFEVVRGYVSAIVEYEWNPLYVNIGSILILGTLSYAALWTLRQTYPVDFAKVFGADAEYKTLALVCFVVSALIVVIANAGYGLWKAAREDCERQAIRTNRQQPLEVSGAPQ